MVKLTNNCSNCACRSHVIKHDKLYYKKTTTTKRCTFSYALLKFQSQSLMHLFIWNLSFVCHTCLKNIKQFNSSFFIITLNWHVPVLLFLTSSFELCLKPLQNSRQCSYVTVVWTTVYVHSTGITNKSCNSARI